MSSYRTIKMDNQITKNKSFWDTNPVLIRAASILALPISICLHILFFYLFKNNSVITIIIICNVVFQFMTCIFTFLTILDGDPILIPKFLNHEIEWVRTAMMLYFAGFPLFFIIYHAVPNFFKISKKAFHWTKTGT